MNSADPYSAAAGDHPSIQIDKRRVRAAFERAAEHYDQFAVLQREVGERMLGRLDYMRLQPHVIGDVGAGTGLATAALAKRYRRAQVISIDLAHAMLQRARRRSPWFRSVGFVGGDAEALPLADGSCDLLFSNLMLQWCNDLERVFAEFRRVLRPGGLLLFSTFGPDTLQELRQCWSRIDGHTHVSAFADMHDIGDALLRNRFADPVMDAEHFTLTYDNARTLMREIKAIGAHNATAGRARGLTGKGRLQALEHAYEDFRRDGALPASYEVVYGHGWVAQPAKRDVDVAAPQPRRAR